MMQISEDMNKTKRSLAVVLCAVYKKKTINQRRISRGFTKTLVVLKIRLRNQGYLTKPLKSKKRVFIVIQNAK